jgi:YD repeat-containing protein
MEWNYLGSVLLGAVVSGAVGVLFSWRSSTRIATTHVKLTWLMKALEAEGVVTFTYDEKGNPVGVTLRTSVAATATSSASASAILERVPVEDQ